MASSDLSFSFLMVASSSLYTLPVLIKLLALILFQRAEDVNQENERRKRKNINSAFALGIKKIVKLELDA